MPEYKGIDWIDLTDEEYMNYLWDNRNKTIDKDDVYKVEQLVCLHRIAQELAEMNELAEDETV